ncbi:hypothetical protein [Rivularia sp. UHCC 0363]|uniref:hypothetical protein n=1 Tax=Rivularia sp. UHCC 0363 TaxID=3110244 RepID=UPI002B20F3A1|nr:hypothetical protein [Rivularia sp. UHCC 0363]MEA5597300.1 hypothetical protein [Rivularia sp. UHCC 0363]
MKQIYNAELRLERLESLKAGTLCALSFSAIFILAAIFNDLLFEEYFTQLNNVSIITLNWQRLISAGIAGFCGFLFGVTYRYIIREDENPHLKTGSVFAFGLIRGLTQVDIGLNFSLSILPFALLALESVLEFAVTAFVLDRALKFGWFKPFDSSK